MAMVTVNNGEASKVKFLDTDAFLTPSNLTTLSPSTTNRAWLGCIEYVATFPNVTVDAGEEYKACVLPVKVLELICTTGNNSPASRPEFVDLSLNATCDIEQLSTEDGIAAMKIMKRMAIRPQVSHLLDKPSFQSSFYLQDLDLPISDLYQSNIRLIIYK